MSKRFNINNVVSVVIILSIFILASLVIRPIIIPIIFALLFAYIFQPLYKKINKKIKSPNISAIILMLILVLVIAIPLIYFTPVLIKQTFNVYVVIQNIDIAPILDGGLSKFFPPETIAKVVYEVNGAIGKTVTAFMNQFINLLIDLPNLFLKFTVFFFTFFFGSRDGDKLGKYLFKVSPFSLSTEKKFMNEFRGVTNSIMLGQVLIGAIQGLALGIGLWVLGVDNVIMLSVITMLVSIIPILGSWLVWFTVSIFLFMDGGVATAIILFFYGLLFVSSIDNFIRPYLLSKSTNLPLGISLIGTIGGLYFMGILGLILGPLILAYALIVLDLYQKGKLNEFSSN